MDSEIYVDRMTIRQDSSVGKASMGKPMVYEHGDRLWDPERLAGFLFAIFV